MKNHNIEKKAKQKLNGIMWYLFIRRLIHLTRSRPSVVFEYICLANDLIFLTLVKIIVELKIVC